MTPGAPFPAARPFPSPLSNNADPDPTLLVPDTEPEPDAVGAARESEATAAGTGGGARWSRERRRVWVDEWDVESEWPLERACGAYP